MNSNLKLFLISATLSSLCIGIFWIYKNGGIKVPKIALDLVEDKVLTAEQVANNFLTALSEQNFEAAYEYSGVQTWGSFDVFSSKNKGFGGIEQLSIYKVQKYANKLEQNDSVVYVQYFAHDPYNDIQNHKRSAITQLYEFDFVITNSDENNQRKIRNVRKVSDLNDIDKPNLKKGLSSNASSIDINQIKYETVDWNIKLVNCKYRFPYVDNVQTIEDYHLNLFVNQVYNFRLEEPLKTNDFKTHLQLIAANMYGDDNSYSAPVSKSYEIKIKSRVGDFLIAEEIRDNTIIPYKYDLKKGRFLSKDEIMKRKTQ